MAYRNGKLTGQELKDYNMLTKRIGKVGVREFHNYWTSIRVVNNRYRYSKSIAKPKFSTSMDFIKSRRIFDVAKKRVYSVKNKGSAELVAEFRKRFYKNLEAKVVSTDVINKFKKMSNRQFNKFIQENNDLKPYVYESVDSGILRLLSVDNSRISARVNSFLQKE